MIIDYDIIFLKPLSVQIDITNNCNYNCLYCYNDSKLNSKKKYLSKKQIIKLIKYLSKNNINSILFSGGEPFLNPDIYEFIKIAKKSGIQNVNINTNGSLILKNIEKIYNYVNIITINIDGNKKNHNKLRGHEKSYQETIKVIKKLESNYPQIKISVITVVNHMNIDEIEEVILKCKKYKNIKEHRLLCFMPIGRGDFNKELELKNKDWVKLKSIMKKYIDNKYLKLGHGGIVFNIDEKINKNNIVRTNCDAGKFIITIDCEGNIYPCNFNRMSDNKAGNILYNDLLETWTKSDIIRNYRNFKIDDQKCNKCIKKDICNGGCRTWAMLNGDSTKRDRRCDLIGGDLK
jgi:radical SAM protein with 4Fe4S-binding SPASM domain